MSVTENPNVDTSIFFNEPPVAPRGRKRKAIPSAAEDEIEKPGTDQAPVKDELNTSGDVSNVTDHHQEVAEKKEKKPKKALAEGMKTGTYDADEEARFLEGLELFGREWTKVNFSHRDLSLIKAREATTSSGKCTVCSSLLTHGIPQLACSAYRDARSQFYS
jgi:hypothetical protein